MESWSVYFIQVMVMQGRKRRGGPIKVGVARNVERRLRTLQTANYNELRLVCSIPCRGRLAAYGLEREIHKAFKRKHIRGEWYKGSVKLSDVDLTSKWGVSCDEVRCYDDTKKTTIA